MKKFYLLLMAVALSPAFAGSPEPASFARFAQAATEGKKLNVVFLGGSLTWGAVATDPQNTSWRALISQKLRDRFPAAQFRFWDAAIGGTGSQLGAFRLERDVLARHPDLVFLEFTINDGAYDQPDPGRLSSYESIARRLVIRGIPVLQVILPAKRDLTDANVTRPLDAPHKAIAAAYGLPSADAVALIRERAAKGVSADVFWDVPEDSTHPGDAGYAVYADAVWTAFEKALADKAVCHVPEKMLHADTYMTVNRTRLSSLGAPPSGWKVGQPHRSALAYDFVCSRWLDDVTIASGDANPQPFTVEVQGADILLFGEAGPKSGDYQVVIDDGAPQSFSTKNPDGNMRHVQTIAQGLDPAKKHTVKIIPQLKPGEDLRLESICVAGAPATVTR